MRGIAVVDCETDPFKVGRYPRPFLWGYFDGSTYKEFERTANLIRFLKPQPLIVYAHNGGKFDWHFILDALAPYDEVMIINGRVSKCWLGMAELRDSFNILPIALAKYKKDKIDYRIMEEKVRHRPENWAKIRSYLKSDCVYLYELISRFVDEFGLQITQASAAMSQWKKLSGVEIPNTSKEYFKELMPYYYGGRVECFRTGIIDTRFSVYDINSAYPYAMTFAHPYSEEFVHESGYLKGADFYKVECVSRGALPYRGEGNPDESAGLRFPNDGERRVYTVTQWELAAALETRTVERVKYLESYAFLGKMNFRTYIEKFYNMRLEAQKRGDTAADLFAKLLMNSLYGKFASNPENYRQYMIIPMDVIPGLQSLGWDFGGELGPWGLAEAKLEGEQERYYNVATSASITGFVRAMLWRAIVGSKGILYCDTDSIATEDRGRGVLLGVTLGAWKHEGDFDKAGIAGKKLYIFRGAPNAKGNRKNKFASKGVKLSETDLWRVASGVEVTVTGEVPTYSAQKAPHFTTRRIKFTAKAERGTK